MSAAEALKAARAAGIQLAIKSEDLGAGVCAAIASGDRSPASLRTEVVALLWPTTIGWTPEIYKTHTKNGRPPGVRRWCSTAWAETLARLDPVHAPSDVPPMRNGYDH